MEFTMVMITFLVFSSVAAAFVLVMTDWNAVGDKQEAFRKTMINRQLQKIADEIAEKEALKAKYDSIISKGYSR
jgi:hypothetical protein